MLASFAILKFVAKAALNYVGFGIGGEFAVEVLPDVARDVWQWWGKDRSAVQLQKELQDVAQLSPVEVARQAELAVAEVAAERPEAERIALVSYLSLIPSSIRQSQRRVSDPSGRTMSRGLSLVKPDDLVPLLPPRLPRFKPGDRPLHGMNLELVEMLGAGGFGEVWKAHNPRFDGLPPVALKFCLDPTAKDRLLNYEATVLNQVMRQGRHPGIVPLLQTYLDADPPFLEYEFVAGGDLSGIIRDARPAGGLPPRQAARIVQEVAEAVGFAHRLTPPIVHRDLKPANILVQRTTDGKVAFRVADFGIGGAASDQAIGQSRLGATYGQLLVSSLRGSYTPLYASPQQVQGNPPDPRDDVYSLGIIWYQLLTGDLFMGAQSGGAWKKRLAEKGMAEPLVDLLEKCINYMPADRPANASNLAERIAQAMPPPLELDMKEALEELRTKGNNRAYFERQGPTRIGAWQSAAQKDAIAQWLLARCLQEGMGIQKDTQAAVSWLRRAAESGLAIAQNDLGDCYYAGEGVEADSTEAFRLYTKAAEKGFMEAQTNLGVCYSEGEGVPKDLAEAERCYRKAAEAGWTNGQTYLGVCYHNGCGVEQDYHQAIGWYRKAADKGDAVAQLNLGVCYEYGMGVKKNWGEAVKWYCKAAEQGNDGAQFAIGYCYEKGRGVEQDRAQAEQWYRKAADQGHRKAKNALRRLQTKRETDKTSPEEKDDEGEDTGVGPTHERTFNTLLREAGLNPGDVRLVRHADKSAEKGRTPYDLWFNDRPQFECYQSTQGFGIGKREKLTAPCWAVFLGTPEGKTMFVGIYGVKYRGLLEQDTPMPNREGVDEAGSCDVFDLTLRSELSELIGKLFIDWGTGKLAWIQYADRRDKPIAELRKEPAAKQGAKVTEPLPGTNLGNPQVRILAALAKAEKPLTRKEIAEQAPCDLASLNTNLGPVDPEKLASDFFSTSLLRLGAVQPSASGIEEGRASAYEITMIGRKLLADAQSADVKEEDKMDIPTQQRVAPRLAKNRAALMAIILRLGGKNVDIKDILAEAAKEGYSENRANAACYAMWENKQLAWSGEREAGGYDFSVTPEGSAAAKNGTL